MFCSAISKPCHAASRAAPQPGEQCGTVREGAGVGPESGGLRQVLLCDLQVLLCDLASPVLSGPQLPHLKNIWVGRDMSTLQVCKRN